MQSVDLGKQTPNVKTIRVEVHSNNTHRNKSPNRSPKKQEASTKNHSARRDSSPNQSKKTSPCQSKKTSPNQSRKTSPNQSRKTSPSQSKRSSPNTSRKSSPTKTTKRTDSTSPKNSRRSSPYRKSSKDGSMDNGKSPKKIKSSLKQPSRSLSIENPTCIECYLSGKTEKG